jgi:hypothetical protein
MHESTLKCLIKEKNIKGPGIPTSKRVTAGWIKQEVRAFGYLITKIHVGYENLVYFKYLGTALTNQSLVYEEIKSRLNSRNACYNYVYNSCCSCLLSKFKDKN